MPESEDENSPDKTALEAELVARKINSLISAGTTVTSNGGERPLEYGDIAILLRSANTVGGVYRRVLGEHGIPVSSVQGGGFFESVEVSTLISMLAVIDNPHKDIPLIAVLRSPSLSFSPDELSDIRSADKKADLYTALLTAAENNEKCRDFVRRLDALRGAAADLSAAELTWRVIEELDMLALCTAMGDGAQRRANLMALVGLSESFEATGYRGVHRYVLWLRRLAEKGQEPSTGGSFSSAVQIMSVHKSKGLEFPVVFVIGAADGLFPTNRSIEDGDVEEERRLFYVATTRAMDMLIITYPKVSVISGEVQMRSKSRFLENIPQGLYVSKL